MVTPRSSMMHLPCNKEAQYVLKGDRTSVKTLLHRKPELSISKTAEPKVKSSQLDARNRWLVQLHLQNLNRSQPDAE